MTDLKRLAPTKIDMTNQKTILIVEDEKHIRLFLQDLLAQDGYRVTAVASGEAALPHINQVAFDLALLDLKLGKGMNGIDVLKALRQKMTDTTVIILTAYGSLETAIEALRLGAHDYLLKPCPADTLRQKVQQGLQKQHHTRQQQQALAQLEQTLTHTLADIRAVITPVAVEPPVDDERFLHRGSLIVDRVRHTVTFHGHLLELSPIQFDLLHYLLKTAPRIISSQELVEKVYHYQLDEGSASNIIRPHIYRLRQKMKVASDVEPPIQTVRGVGYTLS